MATLEYHTGPRGTPGYTVTFVGTVQNYRMVIPAFAQVAPDGTQVPAGTVSDPLYVSGSTGGGASTGTPTQVAANTSAVTLLAANAARKGSGFYYDGAAILYLILSATTPTSAIYTIKMGSGLITYYEPPAGYTGIVKGIWSAATGVVDVTELT